MPGFANLFYMGQPDPAQQLARMLSGQQPPGAPPQQNPNAPAPNAQPVSADPSAAPNPAPGAPPPPGSPPQPQALQSTPDMSQSYSQLANPPNIMSLYVQMQQRQDAMQGINNAFAQIAANHSPPSMRQAIMQGAQGGGGDAGGMVNNLMSLYQGQQQMAAQQQMMGQAPEIAQKLGMPEAYVRAEIMAGRGSELMRGMQPPEAARNYGWFRDQYGQEHANDPGPDGQPLGVAGAKKAFEQQYPPGLAMGGLSGMNDPNTRAMTLARVAWENNPANKGKTAPDFFTDPEKWHIHSQSTSEAQSQFSGVNSRLGSFIDSLGEVANDDHLGDVVGSDVPFVDQIKKGIIKAIPGSPTYDLGVKIGGLGNVAKTVAAAGGPRQGDFATIGVNPDDFSKTGLTKDEYLNSVIAPRMKAALAAQANMWGAAGRANEMPGYLRPYLDDIYQPGGQFDMGGSRKTVTPAKDKKQITEDMRPGVQKLVERYGPHATIEKLRGEGFDTSSLE